MDGDSGGREGRCLFRYLSKLFQWGNETSPMVRCWRQFGEPNDLGDHDFMSVAVLWRGAVAWFCEGSSCLMVRCTKFASVERFHTIFSLSTNSGCKRPSWPCRLMSQTSAAHSTAQLRTAPSLPTAATVWFSYWGSSEVQWQTFKCHLSVDLEKALHYLLLRQSLSGLPPLFQSTHPRNHGAHSSSSLEASAYWAQNLHRSHLSIPFSIAWQFSKLGFISNPTGKARGRASLQPGP